ncbi:MAG TPA: hypothetical protein DDW50_09430 [Firmicutes bacterium]|jgi:hypothetical protein|nr:hypothetical protein [Bacillota bacterium]
MKVWITAMAGLVLFVGLAIYIQNQIQTTSDRFDHEIAKLSVIVDYQQWDSALKKLTVFQQKWGRVKPFWAMLIIHREMDSIDEALVRTVKAIQTKNYSETQMELGSLEHYIQHIPERERFNWVNIL